jgi:parallel beta-helix repeat protein
MAYKDSNISRRALVKAAAAAAGCLLATPSTALAGDREVMAYSIDESNVRTNYYDTLEAIHAGYEGKVIYLACDWMFTGTMLVADSKTITIDMNGHKITSQGNDSVIHMQEHSSLTLRADQISKTFTFTGHDETNAEAERTITTGGLITGGEGKADNDGGIGGIRMDADCTLTLDNIAVSGNWGAYGGGILAKANCTVNINNGATVRYNSGSGGGIRVNGEDCYLNMDNGSIAHNYGGDSGGGIAGTKDGLRITMENGSYISNNNGSSGGGIRFEGSWYYVISRDRTGRIENNNAKYAHYSGKDAYGGGIYVIPKTSDSCEGRIEGLTISGNYGKTGGGGIFLAQKNTRIIDCTISDNTTDCNGGGVYLGDNSKYCSLEGCTVTGNKSDAEGGGVYIFHNLKLAGVCTVKDNKYGSTPDDLLVAEGANFYGQVDDGSCVYLRFPRAERKLIGWDLTSFYLGTYFSDYDDYYIYRGAGGSEAWQFPICTSPKFKLTVTRPTAGQELPKTARFTWSDESWEYFDYGVTWLDEEGREVSGTAELGKKYAAHLAARQYAGTGFTPPEGLSAADVAVVYADDAAAGPFEPADAHVDAEGRLNVTTALIDALTANPEHGDGDDVLPGGSGETDGGAGASDGASADGTGTPATGDATASAATVAVVGGAAALLAAGALGCRED